MKILAIETSCDETAVALLECAGTVEAPEIDVLAHALYSQAKDHAKYGGVYPALAKREHAKNLVPLLRETLEKTGLLSENGSGEPLAKSELDAMLAREGVLADLLFPFLQRYGRPDIDAIAVTQGPGLEPALWVGLNFAKALSRAWKIPLVPVNHMEGHILSVITNKQGTKNNEQEIHYPALALLVSGGHTELVLASSPLSYERVGETRDDAVGEAFDKVARLLGLPYPGGPEISQLAEESRKKNEVVPDDLVLPRPMIHSKDLDFSYAGLKTAALYKIRELGEISADTRRLLARSFEDAAIDVLIEKTRKALETYTPMTLIVGGGVIANKHLRDRLNELMKSHPGIALLLPTRELSTDNAVMIGIVGFVHMLKNPASFTSYHGEELLADGTLRLS